MKEKENFVGQSQPSLPSETRPHPLHGVLNPVTVMRTLLLFLAVAVVQFSRAEVIECDNGDRYNGTILSMDEKTVKLQNDIAGTITIPRERIVGIRFRPAAAQQSAGAPGATNRPARPASQLQFDPASIERIQNEYLAGTTPEANQMFQELVRGLESGQIHLRDVQAQAATTLKQLREAQKELGNADLAGVLDSYAEILEGFLRQAPSPARPPAATPARPQPRVR